jgi:hypothetical protein
VQVRRRRYALAGGALLLVLAAWLGFRAIQIRSNLEAARSTLAAAVESVGSVDSEGLAAQARQAAPDLHAARDAANDPVWRLASAVPLAGRSFALIRGVTQVSARVVDDVVGPAEQAATAVREKHLLADGKVDLALLASLREPLASASRSAQLARTQANDLPRSLVPGFLVTQRDELARQVDRLAGGVTAAATALQLAPGMLGESGPRRYLLVVQNPAEARATGGIVGAYAVLRADRGKLVRERVGTDADFRPAKAPVADLGAEFAKHYDPYQARLSWFSAGRTPDWPSAAQLFSGLWRAQGGGRIDGVIGVDPISMASVLSATGPVSVAGRTLETGNVADFVMKDQYVVFADPSQPFGQRADERKAVLGGLAAAIYDKTASGQGSGSALVKALAAAGRGGHLQVWSSVKAEQAVLARSGVGGSLPGRGAFLEVVSQNGPGSKLDYYVRRTVEYRRPAAGRAVARVTLLNTVDAAKVPPFVKQRVDLYGFNPNLDQQRLDGTTTQLVTIYGSAGAAVERVKVDGKETPAAFGSERGHGYATLRVTLRPGKAVVVEADLGDPGGELVYRQQPLAREDTLHIEVPHRSG